jgi:probable F420-dependent oxidoreductase
MKLGVCLDLTDRTVPVVDIARAAETAGLESLVQTQRIHLPESRAGLLQEAGHEMDANLLDPFVALAAAAAVTSRIKIGTGGCYAALYDPLILAKQVATLDQISGGRFLFGITPGWLEEEIANHGVQPRLRWRVLREKVLAMKRLWTEDIAEFHGEFVDFAPVRVGLRPVQQPHPPILVGSNGRNGVARALEYGDEWFPVVGSQNIGDLAGLMEHLADGCRGAGRTTLPVTAFVWELNAELLDRCADSGISRCVVYLYPDSRGAVDQFLETAARLATRLAA